MNITTLHSFDTEYSADSIEWCRHPKYRSYFACGTYQLDENKGETPAPKCQRKGRIYIFKFDPLSEELNEICRLETAAILDMKWLPCPPTQKNPLLCAANALGQIEVIAFDKNKLSSQHILHLNPEDGDLLALSLDCREDLRPEDEPIESQSSHNQILVSDSKGSIHLIEYDYDGQLEIIHSWPCHSFEAWICAFDKWDRNRVYSGGDDTFLYAYDLRSYERILTNKSHSAGVTCLLSHGKHEHTLLTGSYDEHLRIFDTRSMRAPVAEINLLGGIWRLKSDPFDCDLILAACMYENFSVVHLNREATKLRLVAEYREHGSICYGADWCWCLNTDTNSKDLYMTTCSFYDHKMCVAKLQNIEN